MDASPDAEWAAGVACGRSMVPSSVMVVLRLSVVRASRLAVLAWACASADRNAQRPTASAQMERRRVVLAPERPATRTSLVTLLTSMVRAPIAGSAKESMAVCIRVARMPYADRGGNISRSCRPLYGTMVSIDT
jgi:hypothetical protein